MNRNQLDPALPEPEDVASFEFMPWLFRYHRRLREVLTRNARVTRELQAPPVLRVHRNGVDQALTVNGTDVIQWTTADIDTHGYFSTSTYRFTPKLTGYYWFALSFNTTTTAAAAANNYVFGAVRKNGVAIAEGFANAGGIVTPDAVVVSDVVWLSGLDYLDTTVQNGGTPTSPVLKGTIVRTHFCARYLGAKQLT